MNTIFETKAYQLIQQHYGDQVAKDSGVPLINHIHEGLMILDFLFVGDETYAKQAYCLHPLFQSDAALKKILRKRLFSMEQGLNGKSILLTMEYRNIANQYLPNRPIKHIDEIKLSPLLVVDDMLIATIVQNRKDFELYHKNTHLKNNVLEMYFKNWLARLEINETQYQYYKKALMEMKQWQLLPALSNGNGQDNESIVYVFKDKTTQGRFRLDLVNDAPFKVLHTHFLEYQDGGGRIPLSNPNISGYWKETSFVLGYYVNGECYRGMKESWHIDLSEWLNNKL